MTYLSLSGSCMIRTEFRKAMRCASVSKGGTQACVLVYNCGWVSRPYVRLSLSGTVARACMRACLSVVSRTLTFMVSLLLLPLPAHQ